MLFITFILAVGASAVSLIAGITFSQSSILKLDFIPEAGKEFINKAVAFGSDFINLTSYGNLSDTVGYCMLAVSALTLLGALLCLFRKKFAGVLFLLSAVLCCYCGVIVENAKDFFILGGVILVTAIAALSLKNSTSKNTTNTTKSTTTSSSQRVNLKKGEKVSLTKNYSISKIVVGLGWSVNSNSGTDFDLDASAFLLSANNTVTDSSDFIFYSNRTHPSGAIEHMGDNRVGSTGRADDEQIKIDLKRIPQNISKIIFAVTIYDGQKRGQNFGQVSNAFIRIFDEQNSRELLRYDLNEKFNTETAVVCGELYRNGSEWDFNAIGRGFNGGLEKLCLDYGVNV